MNMSREELITLAAATLYAGRHQYSIIGAVADALEIESETKQQISAQIKAARPRPLYLHCSGTANECGYCVEHNSSRVHDTQGSPIQWVSATEFRVI